MSRGFGAALAVVLAAPACGSSGPVAAPGCLDGVLAEYRDVAGSPEKLRTVGAYRRAARAAADAARQCAEEAGDAVPGCRDAMGDLASALREVGGEVVRQRSLRISAHRARLEGAAAAVAGCSSATE